MACRCNTLKPGTTVTVEAGTIGYDHPYSVARSDRAVIGEADGLRGRPMAAGTYRVICTMCTQWRGGLWALLDCGRWIAL